MTWPARTSRRPPGLVPCVQITLATLAMTWADYDSDTEEWILHVRVTPRAKQDALCAEEDRLRARLRASPTDGKANTALRKLIAKRLRVPRSGVRISAGERSREKSVRVPADATWPPEVTASADGRGAAE